MFFIYPPKRIRQVNIEPDARIQVCHSQRALVGDALVEQRSLDVGEILGLAINDICQEIVGYLPCLCWHGQLEDPC